MWYLLALTLLSSGTSHLDITYSGITPQQYEWDCAPACATTLLNWAGIPQQNHLWEGLMEPGRSISFRHLHAYFTAHGLETAGYSLSWEALAGFLKEHPGSPLLAHLQEERGHFVMIWDLGPGGILLGDPAHGVHFMPAQHFRRLWSGAVLYFPQLHSLPAAGEASAEARGRADLLEKAGIIRP